MSLFYDSWQCYHVPASIGTFLLKPSKLTTIMNCDKQLPDQQQQKTNENNADNYSDDDSKNIHWLCTTCMAHNKHIADAAATAAEYTDETSDVSW